MIIDFLERQRAWRRLNDLEMQAAAHQDASPWRDTEERPWTDEDRAATHRIVQEMSVRLARMELRQSEIFKAAQSAEISSYLALALVAIVFGYVVLT